MRFNLNKEAILNKQFIPSYKGYDTNDVDEFLDLVLKDYSQIDEIVKKNDETISTLKRENESLKSSLRDLKREQELVGLKITSKKQNLDYTPSSIDNLELLKRCAMYEKKLYSLGVDPSKLK